MTDNPKCEMCRWWDHEKSLTGSYSRCRRLPPQICALTEDAEIDFLMANTDYPVTMEDDWCGEHSALRDERLWGFTPKGELFEVPTADRMEEEEAPDA